MSPVSNQSVPNQSTRNLQQQIDDLSRQIQQLRIELRAVTLLATNQHSQHSHVREATTPAAPHRLDQQGNQIRVGDIVHFRPSGTFGTSRHRARGVIVSFTPKRIYIRRETDSSRNPQQVLRNSSSVTLITRG